MIRILVDSSADYTMAELKENGFDFVPFPVTLNDKTYLDTVELDRNDMYKFLLQGDHFPKTSQPSPEAFVEIFEDAKAKEDEVICILLSSDLSGTCQSAFLAKNIVDYDKIYIIDSLTATFPIRILAEHAATLRSQGKSAEEIVNAVEDLKARTKVIASLDTLEYLYRGGRLSRTSASIGNLVSLKPVITIAEDGSISILAKPIGKNKAYSTLLKHLEEHPIDSDFPVYSIYTYGVENCEKLEAKLTKTGIPFKERLQVGCSIGAHIGPGTVGIVYVEKI